MEESIKTTRMKSMLRFWAHVAAAVFGGVSALLLGSEILWRLIPLVIGFLFCGYLIGTENRYASLGNTAGIALAIMLLVSPGATATLHIIVARFLNVMFGITVAIIITRYLWPRQTEA